MYVRNSAPHIGSFDVVKCRKALINFFSGGCEAIYVELTRPEMCGYVGSISESEFGEKAKSNPPYVLHISSAKYDGTVGQHPESYHKALDSKGVEHIMHDIPDGFHGETFVRLHMYNFLKYIFKAK